MQRDAAVRRLFRRKPLDPEAVRLARGVKAHRRAMRWRVALPLIAVGALIVIVPSLLIFALSAGRFSAVAAFMSLLITVPTVILCMLPYALLIVFAFGARRAYKGTRGALGRVHRLARHANLGMDKLSALAVKPVIALNVRYAALERLIATPFRAMRIPESEEDETTDHD